MPGAVAGRGPDDDGNVRHGRAARQRSVPLPSFTGGNPYHPEPSSPPTSTSPTPSTPVDPSPTVHASPSLPSVRKLMAEADLVIAAGTEFGPTDYDMYVDGGFVLPANLVRIDIDATQPPDKVVTAILRAIWSRL